MAYGAVSTPWRVGTTRIGNGAVTYQKLSVAARPKEGETLIVAASNSNNTDRADYVCVPPETMVFCNPSIKQISDIGIGERVLTHNGQYKRVVKTFKRKIDDNLISIEMCHGEEMKATPNHPVLAVQVKKCPYSFKKYCDGSCSRSRLISPYTGRKKYGSPKCEDFYKNYVPRWIPLGELKSGDYVLLSYPKETKDVERIKISDYVKNYVIKGKHIYGWGKNQFGHIQRNPIAYAIPNEIKITPEFMRLAGYYIAEGSGNDAIIQFSFNKNEESYISDTIDIIKNIFGRKANRVIKDSVCNVCVNSTLLIQLFKKLFGTNATNKHIPQWMMFLPREKQKELITGLVNGDGCVDDKRTRYSTTSKQLAYQMRMILFRLGITHSIFKRKERMEKIFNRDRLSKINESWQHEWRNKSSKFAFVNDKYAYFKVRKKESIPYNGYVYNLKVEDDNSYNTVGATLHNCDGTADEVEINQALNALPSGGGSVQLLEGTYNIAASIVIPGNNISLIGGGRGTEILATIVNMVIISATNRLGIFISNLYLHGIAAALSVNDYNGIHFIGVTDSTVSNCWIEKVATDGIALDGSTNNNILGNNLQNNRRTGIRLDDVSTYNRIAENNIENNRAGIHIGEDSPNNTITGNICTENTQNGITNYAESTNIVGNMCFDNSFSGIWSAGSYVNITGNTTKDSHFEGIYVSVGSYITITGNIVQNNTRTGIWVNADTNKSTITGNICEGTTTNDGILLSNDIDNNVVSSNTCTGNGRDGIRIDNANCDNNIVTSNHLTGNTGASLTDSGTGTEIAHNKV